MSAPVSFFDSIGYANCEPIKAPVPVMPIFPDMAQVSVDYLADYLAHVAIGRTQSEIALQRCVVRSAICRRIMKIETLRDLPEWDAALVALQAAMFDPLRPLLLDGLTITAAARHLAGGEPVPMVLENAPALLAQNAQIATAEGMDWAVILDGSGIQTGSMPRALALTGWFTRGPDKGRICTLVSSGGFLAALRLVGVHRRALPLDRILTGEPGLIGKRKAAQTHEFDPIFAAGGADLDRLRRAPGFGVRSFAHDDDFADLAQNGDLYDENQNQTTSRPADRQAHLSAETAA